MLSTIVDGLILFTALAGICFLFGFVMVSMVEFFIKEVQE